MTHILSKTSIFGVAVTATFFIFFLMQALVATGPVDLETPKYRPIPDFIFQDTPPPVREIDRLKRPPEPQEVPHPIETPPTPIKDISGIPNVTIPIPTHPQPPQPSIQAWLKGSGFP